MRSKEEIKQILRQFKLALKSNHLTYHAVLDDPHFQKKLIDILRAISGWNEKDESELSNLEQTLQKELKNKKTIKEKFRTIKEILKISTAGLVGAGAGIAGYKLYKRIKKKE